MLLHLDTSARSRSFSRALTERFALAWRAANPGRDYVHRDLAAEPVPPIGQAWTEICDNLLRHGITEPDRYREAVRTPEQRAAWDVLEPLLAELLAADVVLIGSPMYNFSIPAALKLWIDQVTFPRMSLVGRAFVVVNARGGSYLPGTPREPFDYQERYLRDFFAGHFAVDDVTFINSELTNALVDPQIEHLAEQQRASAMSAEQRVDAVVAELSARRAGGAR
ncbi:FMN-dependent NADH-azoreductase [Saccharopolyspora shandongensis]|uniref:FMN dependent NADH:quinone oxidoreductase n=1 Tax=Saccharopolyspora shandongensis TaxID=418495 RepID=A0A1H2V3E9_9PSEU|nr:NAD(P)H-dependent oxidoreductase [Saccharopolyspora shandongensis]SDW62434.1 FMN-dependent NADH-azoreductase [Saccharopolyspora shandongensis]